MNPGRTRIPGAIAPKILIVDDEPESVRLLLGFLADQPVDTMVALDGEDGLRKAEAGLPSLILLDVALPDADGFEICRRLKANPRLDAIPVIFLSGKVMVEDKLQGFAAGAVDYITKPFSSQEVLARVAVQLAARQRWLELEAMATTRALDRLPHGGRSRDDDLFEAARRLLQESLAAPPGLVALAHAVGTNERKLNEIFRTRVGMTVFEYLQDLRMDGARRGLDASRVQVQRIAEAAGYRNAGDFTRAFKRRYGLSPRQYRSSKGHSADSEAD